MKAIVTQAVAPFLRKWPTQLPVSGSQCLASPNSQRDNPPYDHCSSDLDLDHVSPLDIVAVDEAKKSDAACCQQSSRLPRRVAPDMTRSQIKPSYQC